MTDAAQTPGNTSPGWFNNNLISRVQSMSTGARLASIGVTLVIIILAFFFLTATPKAAWARSDIPYSTTYVGRGQTLARVSDGVNQPAIIMALANRANLNIDYPNVCDSSRYATWPRRSGFFCNDRLNLREANTLVPNQQLRVLATGPTPTAAIAMLVSNVPAHLRVAVLVDGSTPKNLDHAAAIAFALQQRDALASIWVYDRDRLVEFIDKGRATPFNAHHQGLIGALTALSVQPIDRIVVVTGAMPAGFESPKGLQPIIGYCMGSSCEPNMQKLVKDTSGLYVPDDK